MAEYGDLDRAAVLRTLDHIIRQVEDLRAVLKRRPGEYSPFMPMSEFEAIKAQFRAEVGPVGCLAGEMPHRCSRCESVVAAFMARAKEKAVLLNG